MYDTVAAVIRARVPQERFGGGAVFEDFDSQTATARLWLNPSGDDYAPRITYWVDSEYLKVEFSIPKMVGVRGNVSERDKEIALDLVDAYLFEHIGALPPIRDWSCQRVDYCWMWDVSPHMAAYMSVFQRLQAAGMQRHQYASDGVVFKAKGRWVKFYDKSAEAGYEDGQWLRFEVSNYKPAVVYMASHWFGCERYVKEMLRPGRALYAMAREWQKLGLDAGAYGDDVMLLHRLRDVYGSSVASAFYVLHLLREYGSDAHKELSLVSSSSYHTWKKRLSSDGFLLVGGEALEVLAVSLDPLELPFDQMRENLKPEVPPQLPPSAKKLWEFWAARMGLNGAPALRNLEAIL